MVALLRAGQLHALGRKLRRRVELRHESVPSGPGDPDGSTYDAPPRGCLVLAYRQLRARKSMPVEARVPKGGAGPMSDPEDIGALVNLGTDIARAQCRVSSLRSSNQPIPAGRLDRLRNRRGTIRERVKKAL